jgi:hypothetical protein
MIYRQGPRSQGKDYLYNVEGHQVTYQDEKHMQINEVPMTVKKKIGLSFASL